MHLEAYGRVVVPQRDRSPRTRSTGTFKRRSHSSSHFVACPRVLGRILWRWRAVAVTDAVIAARASGASW
jgi:hypothetical protein